MYIPMVEAMDSRRRKAAPLQQPCRHHLNYGLGQFFLDAVNVIQVKTQRVVTLWCHAISPKLAVPFIKVALVLQHRREPLNACQGQPGSLMRPPQAVAPGALQVLHCSQGSGPVLLPKTCLRPAHPFIIDSPRCTAQPSARPVRDSLELECASHHGSHASVLASQTLHR